MKPRANLKLVAEPRSVEDVLRMFLRDRDDAARDIAAIDEQMLPLRKRYAAERGEFMLPSLARLRRELGV